MDGNSRVVTSPQQDLHRRLDETVRKHAREPWRRPLAAHTREAFESLADWMDPDRPLVLDAGCGTGASTDVLALRHPQACVLGVDKSVDRLSRGRQAPARRPQGAVSRTDGGALLVRADLQDFWRLALAADWRPSHQYLLYPNPWPKPAHLGRRWHGHPVLPVILALGGRLELRSNWALYVREFARALELWGVESHIDVLDEVPEQGAISPFERKYLTSGQRCWRLVADPAGAVDRRLALALAGPACPDADPCCR